MLQKKSRYMSIASAAIVVLSSTAVLAQTTMETTTLLNCGYLKYSGGNRLEGTYSAGHMAAWDSNCNNKHSFDYQKTHSIALTVNNIKIDYRIGSSHPGCHSDNSGAKIASDVIWNKSSNYILVNRGGKDKTYAVAIPKSVGLSCDHLWRTTPIFNRFIEIK